MHMNLLSRSNNKTLKGEARGWLTMILHLAPGVLSGYEVCGKRDDCYQSCLYYAGMGAMASVQQSRIARTKLFFEDRQQFMDLLGQDIAKSLGVAVAEGKNLAVRLNGTSDIPWESISYNVFDNIMEAFPYVQFYDYTKLSGRKKRPFNYHLTFSRGSDNEAAVRRALNDGLNVAAVFEDPPAVFYNRPVLDGDSDDLRFLDPEGVVIALRPKGPARRDDGSFVIRQLDLAEAA